MKIGYFADGVWAHKALEKIINNKNLEISFIVPRYSTQDPVLKTWATKLGIDFLPMKNINDSKNINKIKKYNTDLLVSMSFNQIFKKEILSINKLGAINCHAGALPFYRGRNSLNWALINDENSFGVTVHYIDEGIDTGDIISQHKESIKETDDYGSLLKKAIHLCSDLLYHSLSDILSNSANRIKQTEIDPVGSYYKKRKKGDENIDWSWNSRKLFNFVRSINTPGPCARSFISKNEIKIKKVAVVDFIDGEFIHGEVIKKNNKTYIKTIDKFLELIDYETDNNFILSEGDLFEV
jgi:methionyl-tRNA formyltransferase